MGQLKSRISLGLRSYDTAREKNGEHYEKLKHESVPWSKEGSIEPPGTSRETLHGEMVRGAYRSFVQWTVLFGQIEADEGFLTRRKTSHDAVEAFEAYFTSVWLGWESDG